MKSARLGALAKDRRGAVAVEFAVATMPLLLCFFCFLQVAFVFTAKMFVRHAAVVGARAAIVILPPNPGGKNGKSIGTTDDIRNAVRASAGTWGKKDLLAFQEEISDSDPGAENSDVTVKVTAKFKCTVPLGKTVVCPSQGGTINIVDSATLPKQGAKYK